MSTDFALLYIEKSYGNKIFIVQNSKKPPVLVLTALFDEDILHFHRNLF